MTLQIGVIDFAATDGYQVTGEVTRTITPKPITRANVFGAGDRQADLVLNSLMSWSIPVLVYGDDADGLASRLAALNAELTAASNTLRDGLSGQTALSYAMWRSAPLLPPRARLTEGRFRVEGTLSVTTDAWGAGTPVDGTTQTVAGFGLLDMAALAGDLPAPLELLVHTGYSNMTWFLAAVLPAGALLADYLLAAEHGSGWTEVSGSAIAYCDHVVHSVSGDWSRHNLGPGPAGRHRVIARARHDGVERLLGIGGGADNTPWTRVAVDSENYHYYDLGEWASSGHNNLHIVTDGAGLYLDYVLLFPVDESYVRWHDGSPSGRDLFLSRDAQQKWTDDVSVGDTSRYCVGDTIWCPPVRSVLIAAADVSGEYPRGNLSVTPSYAPLHWGWPAT